MSWLLLLSPSTFITQPTLVRPSGLFCHTALFLSSCTLRVARRGSLDFRLSSLLTHAKM